ncbi:MAG: stage 0 sporulation family protein [Clostridia bacterium]|nr:stage 0 sporulation family protein [Clostridia bacterium]
MVNVIGVRFRNDGKLYFFDPGTLWPTPGDYVIVETSRGVEFAETVTTIKEIDEAGLDSPLRPVLRIATAEDIRHNEDNHAAERKAHAICQQKIAEHKLDMKLVRVEFTFDNSKILFYFTANGRVDFRSLVKDLAGVFKTRIELRQIGVRDEAKMLGGLGPCGRHICCGAFLSDFQPVSIKMAKEQNLSLNPTKISGICGRLMCCLKYEQDQYEAVRRQMPKVGKEVVTPDGVGVVHELNVIRESVRVRIRKGDSYELRDYPMGEVHRAGQQPQKNEEKPADTQPVNDVQENGKPHQNGEDQPASDEQTPSRHRREKPARAKGEDGERKDRRADARAKGDASAAKENAARSRSDEQHHHGSQTEVGDRCADSVQVTTNKPVKASAEAAPVAKEETAPAANGWKAALAKAMASASGKEAD